MARSSGASVSSALERIFDSSDSEEVYSPSAEDDEESEGTAVSESPGTSVQLEGGAAAISDREDSDVELPKKKTRKRLKTPERWQKSKRKQRRNSGKKYTSTTGSLVPPKRSGRTSCGCARHCFDKVSEERRIALFDGFWKMTNFDLQNTYICGCVKTMTTKRKYTKCEESRRNFSRVFYVSNGAVSERVCKTAFLSIFSIANGRLSRALQAQAACGGLPHCDQRGRHEPANKTPEERVAFVKAHIDRFPKYESHYSRSDNPNRHYLSPSLSISTMYDLYKSACAEENETPVSEWKYRHIFNTEYNLSFGRPKSDTCKTCDTLNTKISSEENPAAKSLLESELRLHQCKAERAYQQLKEDTALSQSSPNVDMITFDLQQSLPTPKLATNVVFYKRQMWTYNLGVHDCSNGKGFMFMWPESVASRGSQEVCSCVLKYLAMSSTGASHLIAYSDACGGQNRNINVVCMWMHVAASSNFSYNVVDHKFMVSGHSYLPNDRDFGSIETASRRTQHVYVPDDWCTLVEKARRNNPFHVTKMAMGDFISVQNVRSSIVYRKVNTHKDKVNWLDIRWIRVSKERPLEILYRYSHNTLEAWKVLDVHPRRQGRPPDVGRAVLVPLYTSERCLQSSKLQDLKGLLQFIPPVYHPFYNGLVEQSTESSPGSADEVDDE